jgi:hypothetical protein
MELFLHKNNCYSSEKKKRFKNAKTITKKKGTEKLVISSLQVKVVLDGVLCFNLPKNLSRASQSLMLV